MLRSFLSRAGSSVTPQSLARDMARRADQARDAGRHREAATLYAESLRLVPGKVGRIIQLAHMLKECGDHQEAETRYLEATRLTPGDADLSFQLGHFYRSTGRLEAAEAAYAEAARLKSGWLAPNEEIGRLREAGWAGIGEAIRSHPDMPVNDVAATGFATEAEELARSRDVDHVVRELIRRPPEQMLHSHSEVIEFRRLGRHERTHWGVLPTVRGIEALRGFCISATPITELQIYLNDQLVHRGAVKGGYPLRHEETNPDLRKYVFNVWFDFSGFVDGLCRIEFRFLDAQRRGRGRDSQIVVARPLEPAAAASSDGYVPPTPDPLTTVTDHVNSLPSMVRNGRRKLLPGSPRAVLVQRADQLGDLVVSIPALKRLRQLFPAAKLIGLLSAANHDLARTLGIFDEIVTVDFPEDRWEQRRIMSAAEQTALRRRLAPMEIDIAIDLSENIWSRYLLLLTGAPFLFGFRGTDMPSLTVEVEGFTHDRIDHHEVVPHTNKQLGMIEWLGAMIRSEPNLASRTDAGWKDLAAFELDEGTGFIVMHDGARLQFSRWPHYLALATALLERTGYTVVLMTDDSTARETLPPTLAGSARFRLIDRRLPFDELDALLSLCTVFVGNDSGPKHLASLRGTQVVSIHMARNNWNEWGQENGGFIISRRVPCTGCLIHYDPEECGRDFVCMTDIKVQEVFDAIVALAAERAGQDNAPTATRA